MPIVLEVETVKIQESDPGKAETITDTYRSPSVDEIETFWKVLKAEIATNRAPLATDWLTAGSSGTMPLVDVLTAEAHMLAEGYRLMADDDLALAEADLPATREVMPPE
jgi:hypothetical protein